MSVVHRELQRSATAARLAGRDETRVPILFVIGTLDVGGAESQLVEIILNLDRRFMPSVCCLSTAGPLASRLEDAGIPITTIGFTGIRQRRGLGWIGAVARLPMDLARFVRCVRSCKPAILHGVLAHAYVLGALVGRLSGVPVVVASRRSLSHFKRDRRLLQLGERIANRWTDLVIANSEAVRRDALETEGLPPDDVIVIHNGLDTDRYTQAPDTALRRALDLRSGPVVIVVANLIPYKGHVYFLRAWAAVCRVMPDVTAILVGDGPARSAIEADARTLGIEARLRLLGTRHDVERLLAVADLLVHPSLEEGFCNALIEGMAAARPVVATDVGGNREAVVDGETGLLVPPRDPDALASAMLDILGRPDRGAELGRAGRARVLEKFQRSHMVRQYEGVYDALMIGRRPTYAHVRHQRAR